MAWIGTGNPHKPALLLVPPPPFGPELLAPVARVLSDRFWVQLPETPSLPTPEQVLEAVHASAPRPALVVLAGFAGPLLLPSLARDADDIAGVVLLGGPVSWHLARTSSFAEWYGRHVSLLRDLEPEDRCALLVHRLGRSRARPLPDPVHKVVACSPTPDLAPLDRVLHGEPPGSETEAPELPVLVVVGGDDRTLETDGVGGELTAACPDVRTVALPSVGHLPGLEAPDLVSSIITGFAAEPVERWPLRRS